MLDQHQLLERIRTGIKSRTTPFTEAETAEIIRVPSEYRRCADENHGIYYFGILSPHLPLKIIENGTKSQPKTLTDYQAGMDIQPRSVLALDKDNRDDPSIRNTASAAIAARVMHTALFRDGSRIRWVFPHEEYDAIAEKHAMRVWEYLESLPLGFSPSVAMPEPGVFEFDNGSRLEMLDCKDKRLFKPVADEFDLVVWMDVHGWHYMRYDMAMKLLENQLPATEKMVLHGVDDASTQDFPGGQPMYRFLKAVLEKKDFGFQTACGVEGPTDFLNTKADGDVDPELLEILSRHLRRDLESDGEIPEITGVEEEYSGENVDRDLLIPHEFGIYKIEIMLSEYALPPFSDMSRIEWFSERETLRLALDEYVSNGMGSAAAWLKHVIEDEEKHIDNYVWETPMENVVRSVSRLRIARKMLALLVGKDGGYRNWKDGNAYRDHCAEFENWDNDRREVFFADKAAHVRRRRIQLKIMQEVGISATTAKTCDKQWVLNKDKDGNGDIAYAAVNKTLGMKDGVADLVDFKELGDVG